MSFIVKKKDAIWELGHLSADQPFNTLDNNGNIKKGLSLSLVIDLFTSGMSDTMAIFESFGEFALVIQPLKIVVRGQPRGQPLALWM